MIETSLGMFKNNSGYNGAQSFRQLLDMQAEDLRPDK